MFYGDGWICDLHQALLVFAAKCPEVLTFQRICITPLGDIDIKTSDERYVIKHEDFSVWREVEKWIWEEIK